MLTVAVEIVVEVVVVVIIGVLVCPGLSWSVLVWPVGFVRVSGQREATAAGEAT